MKAIDVTNIEYTKGPIYERFKNLSEKKLNYIENFLEPKGFFDNVSYYFDGRKEIMKTISAIKNQRNMKDILDENPEMLKSTLEKIAEIKARKDSGSCCGN